MLDYAEDLAMQELCAAHLMTTSQPTSQPTSPPVDLGNGDSHAAAADDDLDIHDVAPGRLITVLLADPNEAPADLNDVPTEYDDLVSVITEETADHDDVAYRDGLASRIIADEGADQGAGDGAGGDHGAGYGSSQGRRTPWVPRWRHPRNYGRRVVTGFECVSQGCIRMRESEACEYCAVHCLWPEEVSWPHQIEGLCKVHWLKPHRCQLDDHWCSNDAPKVPPLCDFQLCRKHCISQHCKAHGRGAPPPRQKGNRTPGLSSKHRNRSAPYTGPKVKRNHR